jgi:hypothetical protein
MLPSSGLFQEEPVGKAMLTKVSRVKNLGVFADLHGMIT